MAKEWLWRFPPSLFYLILCPQLLFSHWSATDKDIVTLSLMNEYLLDQKSSLHVDNGMFRVPVHGKCFYHSWNKNTSVLIAHSNKWAYCFWASSLDSANLFSKNKSIACWPSSNPCSSEISSSTSESFFFDFDRLNLNLLFFFCFRLFIVSASSASSTSTSSNASSKTWNKNVKI